MKLRYILLKPYLTLTLLVLLNIKVFPQSNSSSKNIDTSAVMKNIHAKRHIVPETLTLSIEQKNKLTAMNETYSRMLFALRKSNMEPKIKIKSIDSLMAEKEANIKLIMNGAQYKNHRNSLDSLSRKNKEFRSQMSKRIKKDSASFRHTVSTVH